MILGDDPPTADDLTDLAAQLRQIKEDTGKSWAQLASDSGIPEGTLSGIASGSYRATNSSQPARLRRWFAARQEQARMQAVIPSAPEWVMTPTAANLLSVLGFAHRMPDMALIAGVPGTGKTWTARRYVEETPHAYLITAERCTATVNAILARICEGLAIRESVSTRYSVRIQERLRGSQSLLIIDEAQNLQHGAIDQMRSIHDLAGVGLVLVGNLEINAAINGMGEKPAFVTAKSRVGMRETLLRPQERDLTALIDAWGITDEAERRLMVAIGRKPGALRIITKVLTLAGVLAAGARDGAGEPRGLAHIRMAAGRLRLSAPDDAAAA